MGRLELVFPKVLYIKFKIPFSASFESKYLLESCLNSLAHSPLDIIEPSKIVAESSLSKAVRGLFIS